MELELLLSGTGTTWSQSLGKPCHKPIIWAWFAPHWWWYMVISEIVCGIRFATLCLFHVWWISFMILNMSLLACLINMHLQLWKKCFQCYLSICRLYVYVFVDQHYMRSLHLFACFLRVFFASLVYLYTNVSMLMYNVDDAMRKCAHPTTNISSQVDIPLHIWQGSY